MATVYTPVAYYATLYRASLPILGIALRDSQGTVSFRDDATQTWQQLTDADAPHLMLRGNVALADAQYAQDLAHAGGVYGWVEARNTEQVRRTRRAA